MMFLPMEKNSHTASGTPVSSTGSSTAAKRSGKFKAALKKIIVAPFIFLIRFYQICISPLKPPTCRFTPTCSQYALEAFRKYGPLKGFWLTLRRLLRCHPWGGSGYDPVP